MLRRMVLMYSKRLKNEEVNTEDTKEVIIVQEHDDSTILAALFVCFLFVVFNRGLYISEIGVYLNKWLFMSVMGVVLVLNIFVNAFPIYTKQKIDRYIHTLLPIEVFTALFNMQYDFLIGMVFLILSVFTAFAIIISMTRGADSKRQYKVIQRLRYPLLAAMIVSLIMSLGFYIAGDKSLKTTVQTDSDVETLENSMVKHEIKHLKVFVDGNWETLRNQQKLDALQRIVNIESTYLGCDAMLLAADTLPDGEGGNYDALQKKIFIDYELLESNDTEKCVMSVIHEVRHRYQDELVSSINWNFKNAHKLRDLLKANSWKNNYDNYLDSSAVGEERYFYQPVEYDAYSYSLTQTEEYFNQMNKFANKMD